MEHLTPSEKKVLVVEQAAGLPAALVSEHVARLDSDYFNEFSVAEMLSHLKRLAALTKAEPFHFDLAELDERTYGLTVLGDDLPGFFSALSGMVASYDFDIRLGKVFTYVADESGRFPGPPKIIDYLVLEQGAAGGMTQESKNALLADFHRLGEVLKTRGGLGIRAGFYWRLGAYFSKAGRQENDPLFTPVPRGNRTRQQHP